MMYNTFSHSYMGRFTMSLHVYFGRTDTYGKGDFTVNLLSSWTLCKVPSACNAVFSLTNTNICSYWYSKELFFLSYCYHPIYILIAHLIFCTCLPWMVEVSWWCSSWFSEHMTYSAFLYDLIRSEVGCSLCRVVREGSSNLPVTISTPYYSFSRG